MKKIIATTNAPKASNVYSQAIHAGNMLFVSGQLPIDVNTGEMPDTFLEQVQQVLKNLKAVVEAAQFSLTEVVKVNIFLTDFYDFELKENYERVYKPIFGEYQDPIGDDEEIDCACDEDLEDVDDFIGEEDDEFDEDYFDEEECFIDNFAVLNTIYPEYFPENPPARSCIAVKQLPKGALIEIECIAMKA
ncbi:MAG: hypothetical protein LBU90_05495 [Bacteroidales bacterium]|jgi:2-iminobutanoate/2-iminopropanoate deaminase|nr:hypothetical protein [Bacteroidales bacterium]